MLSESRIPVFNVFVSCRPNVGKEVHKLKYSQLWEAHPAIIFIGGRIIHSIIYTCICVLIQHKLLTSHSIYMHRLRGRTKEQAKMRQCETLSNDIIIIVGEACCRDISPLFMHILLCHHSCSDSSLRNKGFYTSLTLRCWSHCELMLVPNYAVHVTSIVMLNLFHVTYLQASLTW